MQCPRLQAAVRKMLSTTMARVSLPTVQHREKADLDIGIGQYVNPD